jgi:phosphatidylglycerophosphatase A
VQGGCELTGLRDAGLQGAKLYDIFLGFFLVATFIYGCWACHRVGKELNQADHVGMVWDEIVAFWLVLWLIPAGWSTQLCAFLLFRWFDIVKPAPIRYVEARVKGGIGVMLDDLLAAGYTLLGITIAVRLGVFQ